MSRQSSRMRRGLYSVVAGVAAVVISLLSTTAAQAEDVSNVWYPWQSPDRSDVLVAAKTAVAQWNQGNQYVLGGSGPDVFDCSGLVYYSYHNAGAGFARYNTYDLYVKADGPNHITGRRVGRWEIKPGDLIFYSNNGQPSGIYHVAIYLGWNPGSQKNEQIEAMNPTDDLRVMPYRTSGALNEVVRVFGWPGLPCGFGAWGMGSTRVNASTRRTVRQRLDAARRECFVGRAGELELVRAALSSAEPPFVMLHVHGPGGVGKSRCCAG
jgi:NlpC/P60 family